MSDSSSILPIIKQALSHTRKSLLSANNTVLENVGNIKTAADFLAQNTLLEAFKEHAISCRFYSEELEGPIVLGDGR